MRSIIDASVVLKSPHDGAISVIYDVNEQNRMSLVLEYLPSGIDEQSPEYYMWSFGKQTPELVTEVAIRQLKNNSDLSFQTYHLTVSQVEKFKAYLPPMSFECAKNLTIWQWANEIIKGVSDSIQVYPMSDEPGSGSHMFILDVLTYLSPLISLALVGIGLIVSSPVAIGVGLAVITPSALIAGFGLFNSGKPIQKDLSDSPHVGSPETPLDLGEFPIAIASAASGGR